LKIKTKKIGKNNFNFISDLQYQILNFKDSNPIFSNKRNDNILTYKIQLNHKLLEFKTLTIRPQFKIVESNSSINIHSYTDVSLNFIITR